MGKKGERLGGRARAPQGEAGSGTPPGVHGAPGSLCGTLTLQGAAPPPPPPPRATLYREDGKPGGKLSRKFKVVNLKI